MTLEMDRLGKSALGAALALVVTGFSTASAAAEPPPDPGVTAEVPSSTPPKADKGGSDEDGSNDSRMKPKNYEFGFVTVGAYQTWAVAGHWLYLGAGGGVGPPLFRFSKVGDREAGVDTAFEVLYGNAFARIKTEYVEVDVGPKIAITSELYQLKADRPQGGFSYGGVLDLRFGTETIKVGPRFTFERVANYDYYENAWRITPLMLRVYH